MDPTSSEKQENLSIKTKIKLRLQKMEDFFISQTVEQRENSWIGISLIYLSYICWLLLVMFVIYPNEWLAFIPYLTNGLVNETLAISVITLGIFFDLFIITWGKQKAQNLGFDVRKHQEFKAIMVGFMIWVGITVLIGIGNYIFEKQLTWNSTWKETGILVTLGLFLAQILGVAVQEEGIFRGYLLIQIGKKIKQKIPNDPKKTVFWSITLTNLLFSLMHLPNRIANGFTIGQTLYSLFLLWGIGVLLSFVYLLTENLWFTIILHAFHNMFPLLWVSLFYDRFVNHLVWVFVIILVIVWFKLPLTFEKIKKR